LVKIHLSVLLVD